jgi:hypothetical protein
MEEKIIYITIDKYESLFDEWIESNNIYIDQYVYAKRLTEFDSYLGLTHHEVDNKIDKHGTDDLCYTFKITNPPKFMIAQLKYCF